MCQAWESSGNCRWAVKPDRVPKHKGADQQNAYSITLIVKGIVKLFRLIKREKELYQEILAFLILYNYQTVKIYGHYPVINGPKTTFYRYPIHIFDFTELDRKEK